MKIYFLGSIRGREKYQKNYEKIIESLKELGHTVIENTLKPSANYVYGLSDEEKIEFYKQVLKNIGRADMMVAEGSFSSMGVGYEISLALEKGKPVVVLYEEGFAPHFLEGIDSDKLEIAKYELNEIKSILKNTIEYVSGQMDVRFNFFVSPTIVNYLDWISKKRKMPRAVYLRRLIEKDMEKNKEFKKEE